MVEAFQMMYGLLGVEVWAHPVVSLGRSLLERRRWWVRLDGRGETGPMDGWTFRTDMFQEIVQGVGHVDQLVQDMSDMIFLFKNKMLLKISWSI